MSSSVIKLAKEILGRSKPGTPPMDLREKVDAISIAAHVSTLAFFAYLTVPVMVSRHKLKLRCQELKGNISTIRSTGKPLEKKKTANESPMKRLLSKVQELNGYLSSVFSGSGKALEKKTELEANESPAN